VVLVEVDDQEPGVARPAGSTTWSSRPSSRRSRPWTASGPGQRGVGEAAGLAQRPDELEAEVGVRLNAEVGAVIAQTPGRGHLKVKLAWKAISG
jgi:hypothetical protein